MDDDLFIRQNAMLLFYTLCIFLKINTFINKVVDGLNFYPA